MRYVLLSLFLATPAFAGLPDYCLEAIEKGNEKDVARYAQSLLDRPFPYREEDAQKGQECLLHHTGQNYEYSSTAQQFVLPEEREAAEAAALAAAEERKREREDRERALAEEREARKRAGREEIEREEQLRQEAAMQESIRRSLIFQRLGQACERLYGESPDETISNKLCFDYFLENGLPK